MEHSCVRKSCGNKYEENDPDPYYCYQCREDNKKKAEKINMTVRPSRKVESDLERYDNAPKVRGFPNVNSMI